MSQPTSIQMLDTVIWKELGVEEVAESEAFYHALATLLFTVATGPARIKITESSAVSLTESSPAWRPAPSVGVQAAHMGQRTSLVGAGQGKN